MSGLRGFSALSLGFSEEAPDCGPAKTILCALAVVGTRPYMAQAWTVAFLGSGQLESGARKTQRVHILYYHYGIRSQKTIPIMVFGA